MRVTIECLVDLPDDSQCEGLLTFDVEPGHPGKLYGPPENCYPAEGPIAEYDRGTCAHWETATKKQRDRWEEEAIQAMADREEGAYEDAMERKYDDWKDRQLDKLDRWD